MMEDQKAVSPLSTDKGFLYPILLSIFTGLKLTLFVVGSGIITVLLVVSFSIVTNVYNLFQATSIVSRLIEIKAHPIDLLDWRFVLICIGLYSIFLVIWLSRKPLSLLAYLRYIKRAQKHYFAIYTPLKVSPDAYRTPVTYVSDESGDNPLSQEIDILDLVQHMDRSLLLLGLPGAGKTMFLRYYQYTLIQHTWSILLGKGKIPVFVPMNEYNAYLKELDTSAEPDASTLVQQSLLLDFLSQRGQDIGYIQRYLKKLKQRGRLILLCDGVNEIDDQLLDAVCSELSDIAHRSANQLVITCRELDYATKPDIQRLVTDGVAKRALIHPLKASEIAAFVTKYVEKQDGKWKHDAKLICQRIEQTRLSIHCTNPLMLFTFMKIIDKVGIGGQNPLDTRGLLLQEYVAQIIDAELNKAERKATGLTKEEVLHFLSEIACAARWANDRNAIDLIPAAKRKSKSRGKELSDEDIASDLFYWLDDNPAQGPLLAGSEAESALFHTDLGHAKFTQLLQFARAIELIVVSSYGGVVAFRHELIAEYFVAQYFYSMDRKQPQTLPIRQELLEDVGKWGEPVALWAGLVEKPLELANRLAQLGQQHPDYVTEALMLSLVCISVEWHPPQSNLARPFELPHTVKEILAEVVKKPERRTQVAALFDRCAAEGGVEIYHALLSLLTVPGIDRLLVLLNPQIVPDLLFTHLEHSTHALHYQAHIKPLEKILGEFGRQLGEKIIVRAVELGQDAPQQDVRLRISAVKILGYTRHQRAVEPLIALLSEPQDDIRDAAAQSLVRLGPDLILDRLFKALMDYNMVPAIYERHWTALRILYTFLKDPDRYQLKDVRYQQVLEILIAVLSANYLPPIQEYAQKILIDQGSETNSRQEKVLRLLAEQLASAITGIGDNIVLILQGIGQAATPYLLAQLQRQPTETVRLHSVAILDHVHDPRALDALLSLVADQSQEVFYQVKLALHHYARQPGCIAGVIKLVLYHTRDYVAARAAEILEGFAEVAVEEIMQALPQIVSGRTVLLVRVLEHVHDDKAIPALIALLTTVQTRNDFPLTSAIVHALGKFTDGRVVAPLLRVVDSTEPRLAEEAVKALSTLEEIAFDDLVAALNVEHETIATPRIRQALLEMDSFPGEKLFRILTRHNEALNRQIRTIFLEKGFEAARVLVQHVLYPEQRVRGDVLRTLYAMDRFAVIPAFVEKLHAPPPEFLNIANKYLQQYDDAIPPLVSRLSNAGTVDAATTILLGMGSRILPFMIVGLNDLDTRRQAQQIIKILGRQQPEILPDILGLFALIATKNQQQNAREALIDLLTNDFADVVLPFLLEALEKGDLVKDVAESLLILARRHETKDSVLQSLVQALEEDSKKRHGAEQALIQLESLAVNPVSDLLAHDDQEVAQAAQRVLLKIGVPALPAIWSLLSDACHPARQAAAKKVLYAMPTTLLQEKLLELLASDDATTIEMALTLLLELIQNEAQRPPGNQAMIPALLAHLQTNVTERTSLRVLALLLLLDSSSVVDHLIQALRQYPHHDQRLVQAFLFLRKETVAETLQKLLERNSSMPYDLQAEFIGILGMVQPSPIVDEFAKKSGYYGLTAGGGHIYNTKYLAMALHALGGLLVSGHWDVGRLESLRLMYKGKTGNMQFENKPESELFDILLGDLYSPRLKKLHEQLTREVAVHDQDMRELQRQYNRIQGLEDELQEANAALRREREKVIKLTNENQNLKNQLTRMPGRPKY